MYIHSLFNYKVKYINNHDILISKIKTGSAYNVIRYFVKEVEKENYRKSTREKERWNVSTLSNMSADQ